VEGWAARTSDQAPAVDLELKTPAIAGAQPRFLRNRTFDVYSHVMPLEKPPVEMLVALVRELA
jgi:hypothetical protein